MHSYEESKERELRQQARDSAVVFEEYLRRCHGHRLNDRGIEKRARDYEHQLYERKSYENYFS